MQTASKRVINGWAMFDWANSVYNLVITATIFPTYYETIARDSKDSDTITFLGREFVNTSLYNYALGLALLIVALILPLLTSIADFRGTKKRFMAFFLIVGSISCASMFFFESKDQLVVGLGTMVLACIGFWSSYVFSNSFLPEIAAPEDRDRISARGFAFGYVGSVLLQVICFVFVLNPDWFDDGTFPARLSFLLAGIWWLCFGFFALSRLPTPIAAASASRSGGIIVGGYRELGKVWRQIRQMPVLKRYLGAFFFYNMGVQTVMLAAALYGKSELAIPTPNLIITILLIQLVAIPGAFLISRLSSKIGNFKALMMVIVFWVLLCFAAYIMPAGNVMLFYILGACVGFVMGGIQSLSRSTYSKLMPETKDTASFFSFYDVTEKIAVVIGMFSFGYITELTGSQRNSVLALMIFFIAGLFMLIYTNNTQRKLLNAKQ
ncbi:MAG: MFS transporter [Chitinophagaceae bacterium]|nr:MFS transporter [Chitinophagaceae bacterium]